jgi:methylmalonyl-CoA/ethylmalonyl-CoA epimerase
MRDFEFHHVGIAVPDLTIAIPGYRELFGYEIVLGPFDDPIQNVSVCLMSRGWGDPMIELVAPLGPKSPVDRILRSGGGTYHVCYEVPEIRAAIEHLVSRDALLVSGPDPAVAFGGREIAWLMTGVNLLVELLQKEPR